MSNVRGTWQIYRCTSCRATKRVAIPPAEAPMSIRIGCAECNRPTKQRAEGGSGVIS